MISCKAEMVVFERIDKVYHFVAHDFLRNYPLWSEEVVSLEPLSDGPVCEGFRARQVRVDKGHRTESIFEVGELIPNRRISFSGVNAGYRACYDLEDRRGSTRLTFTFELTQIEARMRPFEKLIRLAVQDGTNRTVRKLGSLIERAMIGR